MYRRAYTNMHIHMYVTMREVEHELANVISLQRTSLGYQNSYALL